MQSFVKLKKKKVVKIVSWKWAGQTDGLTHRQTDTHTQVG